mmetsp:Transcript_3617/g.9124  ORF Transcript_3617/g.9124 Transcript_3617/m.9124 type:complete len:897 (+) Transcript_3617:34-2724(+)
MRAEGFPVRSQKRKMYERNGGRTTSEDVPLLQSFDRLLGNHFAELRAQLAEMEDRLGTSLSSDQFTRKGSRPTNSTNPMSELIAGDDKETARWPQGTSRPSFRWMKLPVGERQPSGASAASNVSPGALSHAASGQSLVTAGSIEKPLLSDPGSKSQGSSLNDQFQLNEQWQNLERDSTATEFAMVFALGTHSFNSASHRPDQRNDSAVSKASTKVAPACMLRPSSMNRLAWDVLGILFILYDVITIPIFLAFNPTETPTTVFMFWLVLSFWTTDIIVSFNTGIYRGGLEEMRRSKVAMAYFKTWFCLDILVVGVDWGVYLLQNVQRQQGISMARVSKTVRTIRIIRSLRLLRIFKVKRLMEYIQDHITSEFIQIILKMANLMFVVLLINHNIACIWYFLGDGIDGLVTNGWVRIGGFDERDTLYAYFTALHWSLTQFTTGSMELSAGTIPERIYSVVVLVFALMVFSSFLSSITASMTQLRNLTNAFDTKFSILRRYLKLQSVPARLSIRILRAVQHKLASEKSEVKASDVVLLQILSTALHRELMQFIHQPKVVRHPFFNCFAKVDKVAIQDLCHTGFSDIHLSAGDQLFLQRASDANMYFCTKGLLLYTPLLKSKRTGCSSPEEQSSLTPTMPTPSGTGKILSEVRLARSFSTLTKAFHAARALEPETHMYPQDWCCEAALWTSWVHVGSMHASTASEVLALASDDFGINVHSHQHLFGPVVQYAQKYLAHLNGLLAKNALSDMPYVEVFKCEEMAHEVFGPMLGELKPTLKQGSGAESSPRTSLRSQTPPINSKGSAGVPTVVEISPRGGDGSLGSGSFRFDVHAIQSGGSHRLGAETGSFASPVPNFASSGSGTVIYADGNGSAAVDGIRMSPHTSPRISEEDVKIYPSWDV